MSLQTIGQTMNNVVKSFFENIFGRDFKYGREIVLAILLGLLGLVGFFGHRWYKTSQEESAQLLFAHNMEEFDRVLQEGKHDDWSNIESLFKLGYDQYANTSLAPFFLVYQSQAMLKQNKQKEAFETFEQAVNKMNASSPLTSVYKTSLALMRLDSQDEAMRNEGVNELQTIAQDTKNSAYDMASYYLGLYYMSNNNEAQGKEVWQKLIDSQKGVAKQGQSPWAMMAQQKLGQPVE